MTRPTLDRQRARRRRILWRIAAVLMFVIAALLAVAQIQQLQQQGELTVTPPLVVPEVTPDAAETGALLPTSFEG